MVSLKEIKVPSISITRVTKKSANKLFATNGDFSNIDKDKQTQLKWTQIQTVNRYDPSFSRKESLTKTKVPPVYSPLQITASSIFEDTKSKSKQRQMISSIETSLRKEHLMRTPQPKVESNKFCDLIQHPVAKSMISTFWTQLNDKDLQRQYYQSIILKYYIISKYLSKF